MQYILSKEEMMRADRKTSEEMHVPSAVLMERAALKIAEAVRERLNKITGADVSRDQKILVVCGPGNNGGDGFAAGRILMEQGFSVDFVMAGDEKKVSLLEAEQIMSVRALKPEIVIRDSVPDGNYAVIIDAVFGVSLSRDISGQFADAVNKINMLKERGAFVIAVDIPSGIDADTGKVMGTAVEADLTVACAFPKIGEVLMPGALYAGKLITAEIGITERSLTSVPLVSSYYPHEIVLPDRKRDSNKGTYGKVLLVAGSAEIAGAAVLSARSALKTGCGMVRVFTHENNRTVLQSTVPEALVSVWRSGEKEEIRRALEKAVEWCTAIAAGPGLGTDEDAGLILEILLEIRGVRPLVLDADALNIISDRRDLLKKLGNNTVITPHVGEMSRLTGETISGIKSDILGTARDFAEKNGLICVLKDSRTVTASYDGQAVINRNGNNGLATAGSGDVLTGIIISLMAQGVSPEKAASLGAALHGKAGDTGAEEFGKHGLLAGDIISSIR